MTDPRPPRSLPAPERPAEREVSLRELWTVVRRDARLIAAVAAGVVALVMGITWVVTPVYESEAVLRVDQGGAASNFLSKLSSIGEMSLGGMEDDEVATEMGVIRSRRIADSVVAALGLHVEMEEPGRPRSRVLRVVCAPADAVPGTYELTLRPDGAYDVRVEDADGPAPHDEVAHPDRPFTVGGATLVLAPRARSAPPERIRIRVRPFRRTVRSFRKELEVDRQEGGSDLIEIAYRDADPALAAAVVNRVTGEFLAFRRAASKAESRSLIGVLREQVDSYETSLADAEERVRRFREANLMLSPEEQGVQQVRRLAAIRAERDGLMVERAGLARLLAGAEAGAREVGGGSPFRRLSTFPSLMANGSVQALVQNLIRLEEDRSVLAVRRTDADPDMQRIERRIDEIESQLRRLATDYLASLDTKIASSDAYLERFGREMEEVPQRELTYARLTRDQMLLDSVYVMLQARLQEAEIEDAVDPGDVVVVDEGILADKPVQPKPWINLALAAVLGLGLGLGTSVVRSMMDDKVRTRGDVETVTRGVAVLGTIPRITGPDANGRRPRWPRRLGANGHGGPGTLIAVQDPRDPASEAYRALRTSISFTRADRPPQVIVITSALPGDGKSTSSANLAVTLAQQGNRTLLVDADLRRGMLHEVFGVPQEPGLTHLLLGRASLDEVVHEVNSGDAGVPLHFLPAGVFPPHPAELLASDRARALLEELRGRYDAVILDAPPLNLVTDAALLGSMADAALLVVRSGVTDREALETAVEQMDRLRAPLSGVVLNDHGDGRDAYYRYEAPAKKNGRR